MKFAIRLLLLVQIIIPVSCAKDYRYTPIPYVVKPTLEITTNYIEIVDLYGGYTIDTGRTELTFFNFFKLSPASDSLDSIAQRQQAGLRSYYCMHNGKWRMRYLGPKNLVNLDSLKSRTSGGGYFQEQTLHLTIDSSLLGKPLFELYHEPTNSVYARYIPLTSGAKLVLKFSGPSNARFDTLRTRAITDQFNYKLTATVLQKQLYN